MMQQISEAFAAVFDDTDAIVKEAVRRAEEVVATNKQESGRLRQELRAVIKECDTCIRLLSDAEIEPMAKKAISRKLGEYEAKRDRLQASLDGLTESANDNTERLALTIRRLLDEARVSFSNIASPIQLNAFVREHLGEVRVGADGVLSPFSKEPEQSLGFVPEQTPPAGLEPATCRLTAGRSTN